MFYYFQLIDLLTFVTFWLFMLFVEHLLSMWVPASHLITACPWVLLCASISLSVKWKWQYRICKTVDILAFHHGKAAAAALLYMAFSMLRYVPSIPTFWIIFYHKWVLNFVKSFFYIYWDGHVVLFFSLLMWYITLIETEKSLTP